ncbi:MAG: DUF3180 domain-containing protein [Kineosporiaceae bacterium]
MTTTRGTTVLAVAVVCLVLSWAGLRVALDLGWSLPSPPWAVTAVIALLAVGTLAVAWPVRQWTAGRRDRPVDPLRAARTVALAKASVLTGAVVTGFWGAFAVTVLPRVEVPAQTGRAVAVLLAVVASVGLLVAGMLAERWCRIPPEDDAREPDRLRAPDGSAA